MRVFGLLSFIVLAVVASVLVSAGPVAAQGSGIEPTGGTFAIRTRSEGAVAPPRIIVPAAFGDFRLSFQLAFARYRSLGWLRTRALDSVSPADLPTRRRGSL